MQPPTHSTGLAGMTLARAVQPETLQVEPIKATAVQMPWQQQTWVLLTEQRVVIRLDFAHESADVRCVVHAGSVAEAIGVRTGSLLVAVRGVPIAGLSMHEVCGGPFSRNDFRCQI